MPRKLVATGPVRRTCPSSRQVAERIPPSATISADRPSISPRWTAATTTAQTPLPQARCTDTAFPDAHPHPTATERRDEFDIRAFRKQRMMFDRGAVRFDVDRFRVVDEENAVRIPIPTATGPENPSIRSGKSSAVSPSKAEWLPNRWAGPISTVTSPLAAGWLLRRSRAFRSKARRHRFPP